MKHDTWHIQLFGPLCARRGYAVHTRFRTRQTGELLACLAIFPDRVARREELIELLWPGCTQETGRNNLRMALSSLRGILDPREGRPLHEDMITLLTDRTYAQLNPAAYTTDKSEFETILRSAPRLSEQTEQADALQAALRLYSSELLPDYQAQWIVDERRRLSDAHLLAMRRLVVLLFKLREFPVAFDYAHRAISIDPLREESHYMLLQLYVGTGQAAAAARHYQEMEAHLYAEVGLKPSARTRALMEQSDGKEESGSASMSARTLTTQATGMSFPSAPLPPISPRRHLQRRPLPLPNSPLFGREDELADVCAMIHTPQTRLVTLTGLGGSGKTRLALALAEQLQEEFDGAVWFVRLESLQEPQRILQSILNSVAPIPLQPRADPHPVEEQISQAIGDGPALFILDNYEQLLPAGALQLRLLLEAAPDLHCLVTSRQRLNISGEYEYAVMPLPTPAVPGTPARLIEFASVQLYAHRARQVRTDFSLTSDNSAAIAALCHYLEGVPLAIELAAAYAQTLTPAQIHARLKQRFPLLINRLHDAPPRHASLRAALDWSYQLLPLPLQRFLVSLSVLRGQWSLRVAHAVAGSLLPITPDFHAGDDMLTLQALAALRERSLLLTYDTAGEMRYAFLETVREFAQEQALTDELHAAHLRLALCCLALALEAEPQLTGPRSTEWLTLLEREHDNLRAALRFLLEPATTATDPAMPAALPLAAALHRFWYHRAHYQEGLEWLERALQQEPDPAAPARLPALLGIGNLAYALQDLTRAHDAYTAYYALACDRQEPYHIAAALGSLGHVAKARGNLPLARALREDSLYRFQQLGDTRNIALTLANIANIASAEGAFAAAQAEHTQALALFRTVEDAPNIVLALNNLAHDALQRKDIATAIATLRESLRLAKDTHSHFGMVQALLHITMLAAQGKREHAAAELLGYAEQQLQQYHTPFGPEARARIQQTRHRLADVLGEDAFLRAYDRGRTLQPEQITLLAEAELRAAA